MKAGWRFLVAILDLISMYIWTGELIQTIELDIVLSEIEGTLLQAVPNIWNSDQGSHFIARRI
jgi:putative transposase